MLVQKHLRLDLPYDDDLLPIYIGSATSIIESYLNRSLITQTLQYSLVRTTPPNAWPLAPAALFIMPLGLEWTLLHSQTRDIGLPRNPVQSVTSVSIGSWGQSDLALVEGTDYDVDLTCDPARIHLFGGNNWEFRDHITMQYVAGYSTDSSLVPLPIIHGILLCVASMYENRGDEGQEIPEAVFNLCSPYRLMAF